MGTDGQAIGKASGSWLLVDERESESGQTRVRPDSILPTPLSARGSRLAFSYRLPPSVAAAASLFQTNRWRKSPMWPNVPTQFRCSIDSCRSSGITSSS